MLYLGYAYILVIVHDKVEPIAGHIKAERYKKAYDIALSTTILKKFNYSKTSNKLLSYFYMFEIDNIVQQNFNKAEEYCYMAKEMCSLEYLYKEAISYYCGNDLVEYPAYGYEPKNKINFNKKCTQSQKNLTKIKTLQRNNYKNKILYWLPIFH